MKFTAWTSQTSAVEKLPHWERLFYRPGGFKRWEDRDFQHRRCQRLTHPIWSDGVENLTRNLLNVLEALGQQLRVAAIHTDVILGGGASVESDRAGYDKGDRFGLRLADALGRRGAALGAMHHLVGEFVGQSCELFGRRQAR